MIWGCIVVFWLPSAAKQPLGEHNCFSFFFPPFMGQRSVEFSQNKNVLLRPSSSEQFHFIAPVNSLCPSHYVLEPGP